MSINLQPIHDRIVIKRVKKMTESSGGIIIPEGAGEKPSIGVVLAIGSGKKNSDGSLQSISVRVGQKVVFGKWAGTALEGDILKYLNLSQHEDDGEILIVKEDDIMAIISE